MRYVNFHILISSSLFYVGRAMLLGACAQEAIIGKYHVVYGCSKATGEFRWTLQFARVFDSRA